jgi:Zn-finger nucleic acid-binding protein
MNCKQCGAPMILVRDRDYYFCEYCGVYHFPNPSADGIRNLGEAPERITCPLCNIPLDLAIFDDHYRGHQCSNCKGILFNRGTFRKTLEARRAKAASPAEPVTRASETELGRQVFCPKCKQRMSTHHYLGPGNIIIDTCHTCDLIWLDYGELNKAVSAPGNDRGSAHREQTVFLLDEMKKREKKDWNQQEIDLLDFIKKILW